MENKRFTLRLPLELAKKLESEATISERSLHSHVLWILKNYDTKMTPHNEKELEQATYVPDTNLVHRESELTCDRCRKKGELRIHWEQGVEYRICKSCIQAQYGKLWQSIWKKMQTSG